MYTHVAMILQVSSQSSAGIYRKYETENGAIGTMRE